MSHNKYTKRNFSLYLDKWNPSAKKYINICCICGRQGYSHVILDVDFYDKNPDIYTEKRVIYEELIKILNLLRLDELGRCEVCAEIQEQNYIDNSEKNDKG